MYPPEKKTNNFFHASYAIFCHSEMYIMSLTKRHSWYILLFWWCQSKGSFEISFLFLTITWTLTMVYKKDVDILMILMFMVHLTDLYRLAVGTVRTKLYRAVLRVPTHCTWGIPIYHPYRSPVRSIHVAHTKLYATVRWTLLMLQFCFLYTSTQQ